MRYSLRTLLILLAVGPPALAWSWSTYNDYLDRQRIARLAVVVSPYTSIRGTINAMTIHVVVEGDFSQTATKP